MSFTSHELLVDARNLLDRDGWIQGTLGDAANGRCARGALMDPCRGIDGRIKRDRVEAIRGAEMRLAALIPTSEATGSVGITEFFNPVVDDDWKGAMRHIIRFNNAAGRTLADVVALFDEAIGATAPEPDLTLETRDPIPA